MGISTLALTALAGKTGALQGLSALALFDPDSISSGNSRLLMIFVALCSIALIGQAISLAVVAFGVLKARTELLAQITELKGKILPLVEKSHTLVTDMTPQVKDITAKVNTLITDMTPQVKDLTAKVQTLVAEMSPRIVAITDKVNGISGHVEEITCLARDKANEFSPTISAANQTVQEANTNVRATAKDVNDKTRAQIQRVNDMVTGALDATANLGKAISHGISQPGREIAGMVSGAKTTFEHLIQRYGGLVRFGSKSGTSSRPAGAGRGSPYAEPFRPAPAPPATVHLTPPAAIGNTAPTITEYPVVDKRDLDL